MTGFFRSLHAASSLFRDATYVLAKYTRSVRSSIAREFHDVRENARVNYSS